MHNFVLQVEKKISILKIAFQQRLRPDGNFFHYPMKPKVSDIELISISLVAQAHGFNSENQLFSQLPSLCPGVLEGRISRPRYNIRLRNLALQIEDIPTLINTHLVANEQNFIVDSMPLPICKLARRNRAKVCKDNDETLPSVAKCHAKDEYYFGFKMHLVTTQTGLPYAFKITSSRVHDLTAFAQMSQATDFRKGSVLGDKGYVSKPFQLELFETKEVKMIAQPRVNMKTPFNWTKEMGMQRKRIETLFSQLNDQFSITKNLAKKFVGFYTRIALKLASALTCQVLNLQSNRNVNLIKSALFV
jgi:hypothetical protein